MTAAGDLESRLKQRLRSEGPISVADYMSACLADPAAGYYRTGDPIGAEGDFITAPEVSQIFGELIGLWCAEMWRDMGAPEVVHFVELGPGRGTAMADMLRAAHVLPAFRQALSVHLVECSATLRARQAERLADLGVLIAWHEDLSDVPQGPTLLLANEFFDALPIRQFLRRGDDWLERYVELGPDEDLRFTERPARDAACSIPGALEGTAGEGAIFEVRPEAPSVVADLAERATDHPLAALVIDYGHVTPGLGDTLQALRVHTFHDPLDAPGQADLTAHVDFAALATVAESRNLCAWGPMAQGAFLLQLGLTQRLQRLAEHASDEQRPELIAGAERLVAPEGMGGLFKVMALTSPDLTPPPFAAAGVPGPRGEKEECAT